MKILITHLGDITDNFIASSILKGLHKKYDNPEITWVTRSNRIKSLFKYNKRVKNTLIFNELINKDETFDLLINLCPNFNHKLCKNVKIKDATGFSFQKEFDEYIHYLYLNKTTKLNYFQIYYNLSQLKWKGEGYDIAYYPKTKSKNNRAGIAIAHNNLRSYVTNELDLKTFKKWDIPYKTNIFRRMDEVNKCKSIVTDDFLTFNIAVCLRKYVYFLQTFPYNIKLEFFNQGEIFNVPINIIR